MLDEEKGRTVCRSHKAGATQLATGPLQDVVSQEELETQVLRVFTLRL